MGRSGVMTRMEEEKEDMVGERWTHGWKEGGEISGGCGLSFNKDFFVLVMGCRQLFFKIALKL